MFLVFGIDDQEKILEYNNLDSCVSCGRYNKYKVYKVSSAFSLFFIPMIKWNKRYFVESSCCNSIFELKKEVGLKIEKGENITIKKENLRFLGYKNNPNYYSQQGKKCFNCGYIASQEFQYCPKCGNRL